MRLRFWRSPPALPPCAPWALAMRSLRRSSFDFFFGRVVWLMVERSILPMTLMVGRFSGRPSENTSGSDLASSLAGAAGASLTGASALGASGFGAGAAGFSSALGAAGTSAFGASGFGAGAAGFSSALGAGASAFGASGFGAGAAGFSSALGAGASAFGASAFGASAEGAGAGSGLGFTGLPWRSSSILPSIFGLLISDVSLISEDPCGAADSLAFSLSLSFCCCRSLENWWDFCFWSLSVLNSL